jgi:endonuclease/exonuclease/phosphatase family metal-dependent hydrolase
VRKFIKGALRFASRSTSLRILRTVELTALSWNLFHGRDHPPDPELRTWRSRLLRFEERNQTHIQVNRDLTGEFATLLSGAEWDVALLQECPPRFAEPLARACRAEAHRTLTSRNSLGALRGLLARQNPDLMASGEGGSNLILVRVPGRLGGIAERREMAIHEGEPERRAMGFVRTASGLCVANLHATNDWPELAAEDVVKGARGALEWAGGSPLLFGGDFNLRPGRQPRVFERLRDELGLHGPTTAPDAIDHILSRGLEVLEAPRAWPPEQRELQLEGLALRLSDHAPVEARFLAAGPHLLRN